MRWTKRNPALLAAALAAGLQACSEPAAQHEPELSLRQPLQGVTRVRDINPRPERFPDYHDPENGSGLPFTTAAGVTYLSMFDWLTGTELWRSDGTEAGTRRIKDIAPGLFSSYPSQFVEFQGTVYFSAKSDFLDVGLWKTDGTEAGTVPVKRFVGEVDPRDSLIDIATVGNQLLFIHGHQLWRSDGTEAGTVLLKVLSAGNQSYYSAQLVPLGGAVFFTVTDAAAGVELWKTDGTEAGTTRVCDVVPGELNDFPAQLIAAGGSLYFTGSWQQDVLWKTDGTEAGTVRVNTQPGMISLKTALPDALLFVQNGRLWRTQGTGVEALTAEGSGAVKELVAAGGTAFFSTSPASGSSPELWKTDGTVQGTVPVGDLWPGSARGSPKTLRTWRGELLFTAATAGDRTGLWKTNGTPAGTTVLKDWPAASDIPHDRFYGDPTAVGPVLFFKAPDSEGRPEVWRTDGTAAGARAMAPLNSRTESSRHGWPLAVLSGGVLFTAADGSGNLGLWKSDGTEAGTALLKRFDVDESSGIYQSVLVGSTLFFVMDDGVHGEELWKSDGTEAGTGLVKDIRPGAESSWLTDLTVMGNTLFFSADDRVHGKELWKSDGTEAGTALVRDLELTPGWGAYPLELTAVNGTLYFAALKHGVGRTLWKSDGTEAGTVPFLDVSSDSLFTDGNTLFFTTQEGALWKSDGTEAGTLRLRENVGYLRDVKSLNGRLYFTLADDTHGSEPWTSDGTPEGTRLLADLNPGAASSDAAGFTKMGAHVLFSAYEPGHGYELWRTDGTEAGTVRMTDARPGPASGLFPALYFQEGRQLDMLVMEDRHLALFAGIDEQGGIEPWVTDGTPQGTQRWVDAEPGTGSSTPLGFARVGNSAVFFAGDGAVGRELFRMPLPELTAPTLTCPANVSISTEAAEGARVDYPAATATASLGTAVLSYSQASGTVFPVGTHVVTVSATDTGGRRSQCTFSVTVNRQASPEPQPAPGPESQSGCGGCASSSAGTSGAAWGLLLLGLAVMRRLNRGC